MARKLRVEYPGAIYHVMNRGDRREPISKDEAHRQRFVETLGETCAETGWQVHVYVLMPNHFHLVVETPQPNLVAGMKWFLGTYTSRFNRRHKLSGHLFSGRYRSLAVDGSGSGYLNSVCHYVHLNRARAKRVEVDQPLKSFAWSSWPAYLLASSKRPVCLQVDRSLRENGVPKDGPAGRRRLEQTLEERRGGKEGEEFKPIRRGWCLATETFRQELLAQMNERLGSEHYGEERAQTAEALAEQIIAEELKRRRWKDNRSQDPDQRGCGEVGVGGTLLSRTEPDAWPWLFAEQCVNFTADVFAHSD
jgi:REP element-mobilizing transposase RayT